MEIEDQPNRQATPKEGEEFALREAERFIRWLCRRYEHSSDYEDLLQLARLGALRAIRTFDASKGANLATYIAVAVRSELSRHFSGLKRRKRLCPGPLLSLNDPIGEDEEEELEDTVADEREDVAGSVVAGVVVETILETITKPRARKALELRILGATLEETGEALGVTRERARQLEMKALQEIRRSRLARAG
jgi:RNA polymerase sigma factor, sigma-70 family